MVCFCHASVGKIEHFVSQFSHPAAAGGASAGASASVSARAGVSAAPPTLPLVGTGLRGENIAKALWQWLGTRELPGPAFTPDPQWLRTPLPQMQMTPLQGGTVSLLGQLRAQAQSQLGLDLLHPAQAKAFSAALATMKARLAALAHNPAVAQFSPRPWVRLATLNDAVTSVQSATSSPVFAPSPAQLKQFTTPGGQPMAVWEPFAQRLRELAPMIAATRQLGIAPGDTQRLAAAMRSLTQVKVPTLTAEETSVMNTLSSAMSAVKRLTASLGGNPLQQGYAAVAAKVQASLNATLRQVSEQLGVKLAGKTPETALAEIMQRLPQLPPQPSRLVTAGSVKAALEAKAMAALKWQVPETHPAAGTGLLAMSFAERMQATLGGSPFLARHCTQGCDAELLASALG